MSEQSGIVQMIGQPNERLLLVMCKSGVKVKQNSLPFLIHELSAIEYDISLLEEIQRDYEKSCTTWFQSLLV